MNYKECITEESRAIQIATENSKIIDKTIYSALENELKLYIKEHDISKIYLCGIDTECCVLKTAFDLFESGYDVYILKDYCACMRGLQRHENTNIETPKDNINTALIEHNESFLTRFKNFIFKLLQINH